MNNQQIEKLLALGEGDSLEFKESLDLQSNEGKAKFLRAVLSLANSPVNAAYLVVGIEDKTKKVIGVSGITEEQVQQIISEWCRPPIDINFEIVEHKRKSVGVMRIYPGHQPHTLKKSISYPETTDGKKQSKLHENQVFVRRGSIISEATVDEILEMAQQDAPDLSDVISRLDRMIGSIDEITYSVDEANDRRTEPEVNRYIENTFVAMVTGLITAWLWIPGIPYLPILTLAVSLFVTVTASVLRLTHFGVLRAIFSSLIVSVGLGLLFDFGARIIVTEQLLYADLVSRLIFGLLAGAMVGVIGQLLISWIESRMIRG